MGSCLSNDSGKTTGEQTKETEEEKAEKLRIKKERAARTKKLLFLGSGGSGKSTFFKNLRTIHGNGYTKEDRLTFIDHIHAQIIEQMKLALECIEFLVEEWPDDKKIDVVKEEKYEGEGEGEGGARSNKVDANRGNNGYVIGDRIVATWADFQLNEEQQAARNVIQTVKDPKLTDELAAACKTLWRMNGIKKIYEARAIMKIETSSNHFWDSIDRVMQSEYVPDENDIYLVRYRTTGVIDQKFEIKKSIFHIFDVGGQKSERKKWIHCFENVTAVLFIAALDAYNEVMFEDEDVNSMSDALNLFDQICNNTWFEQTTIVLFLNKKDLFANEIQRVPITVCPDFVDYEGDPTSFDETTSYIKQAFIQKNKCPDDKSIFTHLCCARDQNNVEKVFNDVQHIIIENSLMSAGLMGDFGSDDNDTQTALM